MIDLLIRDEGTVVVLMPQTDAAREWIDDNICSEPWQWLGSSLAVDHRYAPAIIQGAAEAGLGVAND